MEEKKWGGARPGAGRKPGKTGAPDGCSSHEGKQISLYPHEWERLDKEAKARGLSRSGLIRKMLQTLCEE